MKRIAVWNTAFLGDAVLTLPVLQALRLHFPGAEIDFYVRGGLKELFAFHPAAARVFSVEKRGRGLAAKVSQFALARDIARRGYDLWIGAHASLRSGLMAGASGAAVRVGYTEAVLSSLWYTHRVSRRFDSREEIERLLGLLEPLRITPASAWPEIALAPEAKVDAEAFFSRLRGPVLGLHPGSVWGTKRWPARSFAEVGARALLAGATVLLFAGPGEEAVAAETAARVRELAAGGELSGTRDPGGELSGTRDPGGVENGAPLSRLHDLSGALSLPRLAAYLGRLSCYLTNDSGPMHLAWAQRVPVTAVFGPTVRKLGFFPRGEGTTVFEAKVPCRPCGLHGPQTCPLGHHECMTRVPPEAVWEDVRKKLGV